MRSSIKVFFTDRKDKKVFLSEEELQELLDKSYEAGYSDGAKILTYYIPEPYYKWTDQTASSDTSSNKNNSITTAYN